MSKNNLFMNKMYYKLKRQKSSYFISHAVGFFTSKNEM